MGIATSLTLLAMTFFFCKLYDKSEFEGMISIAAGREKSPYRCENLSLRRGE